MPWRVGPEARKNGERPDPYRVWLSEIMLQQTTVAAVRAYFRRFTERWPTVADLAAAADADVMGEWAGLGYYARARNLLKGARAVVADHGGQFPDSEAGLRSLPGIGPYTAAAVAAIAFDRRAVVVDGNVERVISRLFAVTDPLPGAKRHLVALAGDLTPDQRPGDHAQAMMDLGATICTPRKPACGICPVRLFCAGHESGIAGELPRKTKKTPRPERQGIAYVAQRADGALLVETRPERGLLGGMPGWPGTEWAITQPIEDPPLAAEWVTAPQEVRHVFTHFGLTLQVRVARVALDASPARGAFVPRADFRPSGLPTVMRKVHDAAQVALSAPPPADRLPP